MSRKIDTDECIWKVVTPYGSHSGSGDWGESFTHFWPGLPIDGDQTIEIHNLGTCTIVGSISAATSTNACPDDTTGPCSGSGGGGSGSGTP